jgi:peptidyl-prolyl cis-trans isomerase-like 4
LGQVFYLHFGFRILFGEQAKYFEDEIKPHIRHKKPGMLGMASTGPNLNASQVDLVNK